MPPTSLRAETQGGARVIIVRGSVDRGAASEIDRLIRHGPSAPADVAVDVSDVDEINGALIGALLRASRRLAWRNRRLTIVCARIDLRSRLEIAGLDELADVVPSLDPRR